MWDVNKVEIPFSKIGLMESKWPTLNAKVIHHLPVFNYMYTM